eukprot:254282_1
MKKIKPALLKDISFDDLEAGKVSYVHEMEMEPRSRTPLYKIKEDLKRIVSSGKFRWAMLFGAICLCVILAIFVPSWNGSKDTVPLAPVRAEGFSIEYFDDYKIVRNTEAKKIYVLYAQGRTSPTVATLETKPIFAQIPFDKVNLDETVIITFMELLGLRENILLVGNTSHVTSPCLNSMISAMKIQNADAESAAGMPIFKTKWSRMEGSVDIFDDMSNDMSPLHHSQWIKFYAAFFNMDKRANEIYDGIEKRYLCHSAAAKNLVPESGAFLVAFVEFAHWKKPQPKFLVSTASYKVDLVEDAGGRFLTPTVTEFDATDVTSFHDAIKDVHVLIDETYYPDPAPVTSSEVLGSLNLVESSPYKFVENKLIYRLDRTINAHGSLDWYESRFAQADVVLLDMISILNKDYRSHSRTWFRNVFHEAPLISDGTCTSEEWKLPLEENTNSC